MRKGLREISQRLTAGAGLLGVQSQMVRVTQHPLEDQSSFIQPSLIHTPRARERFNEPEGAEVECPFNAFKSVAYFFRVVAIDQAVGDQSATLGRLIDRVDSIQHFGV